MIMSLFTALPLAQLPTPITDFCADVIETLTIDGTPPQIHSQYRLCVDKSNVRWNQVMLDRSSMTIFNGTDVWKLVCTAYPCDPMVAEGWDCQTKKSGPESPDLMPYAMTKLDDGTTVNQTSETYDNITGCVDLWHLRQVDSHCNPIRCNSN